MEKKGQSDILFTVILKIGNVPFLRPRCFLPCCDGFGPPAPSCGRLQDPAGREIEQILVHRPEKVKVANVANRWPGPNGADRIIGRSKGIRAYRPKVCT